jgi:hypothetical protein
MASPLLAMIGAITLATLGIVAIVSLTVIAVQAGLALGRAVSHLFAKQNAR